MKISSLNSIFGSSTYSFIVDSEAVYSYVIEHGQKCLIYKKNMKLPDNCVNIQTSVEHFISLKDTALLSPESRILTIPLIAFDNSFECFKYLFHRLYDCDFPNVFSRYRKLIRILKKVGTKFLVKSGNSIQLVCSFNKQVAFSYPKDIQVNKGKIRSIAEYFEVNFNHLYPHLPSPFNLNGKIKVSSCLYAIHPSVDNISSEQKKYAKKLFGDIYKSDNCIMTIENNDVKSLEVDGIERINDVITIAGSLRKANLTEFAFGLNSNISESIIWSYNSQINEGCMGIHLGCGDGKTGIHMDFISPVNDSKELIIQKI
jgi:hypothetical protein